MRSSRLPCFKVRDSEGAVDLSRIDIARRGGCAPCLLVFFAHTCGSGGESAVADRRYRERCPTDESMIPRWASTRESLMHFPDRRHKVEARLGLSLFGNGRLLCSKDILLDLARRCFWQLGYEVNFLRRLEVRQMIMSVIAQLGFRRGRVCF